jgi:Mrp family chromosome partitioning ATPase
MSRYFDLLKQVGKDNLLVPLPSDDLTSDDVPLHLDCMVAGATVKARDEDLDFLTSNATSTTHDRTAGDQLDGTAREKIVASEKRDALFRGLQSDPQSRDGARPQWNERVWDEVGKLVQRVFVFPSPGNARLVVFAGVDAGRGSSEICFCAGEVLAAQASGSVCLVDANQRAPFLHHIAGIGRSPGLAEALINSDPIKDFAVPITGANLWLVPPGAGASEAPGSFPMDRFCARLAELREEFDYVLIDTPPVNLCTDALLLGQKSDGVILIVEANSTRRETARMVTEAFQAANVKLLGAILNNRTFPIPEALYKKL